MFILTIINTTTTIGVLYYLCDFLSVGETKMLDLAMRSIDNILGDAELPEGTPARS